MALSNNTPDSVPWTEDDLELETQLDAGAIPDAARDASRELRELNGAQNNSQNEPK